MVVIPAGVPRKPGMTRDDLFNVGFGFWKVVYCWSDNLQLALLCNCGWGGSALLADALLPWVANW